MSRTYAVLEISKRSFTEIQEKLRKAGYGHLFNRDSKHPVVIDMEGVALAPGKPSNFGSEEMQIWPRASLAPSQVRG